MRGYALRVRDDATGRYVHFRGSVMAGFSTWDEAEEVRRAMPNGAEFEIMEVGVERSEWVVDVETDSPPGGVA